MVPSIDINGGIGDLLAPLEVVTSLSLLPLRVGAGLTWQPASFFHMRGFAEGGYGVGFMNDGSQFGGAVFLSAGGELSLSLGSVFRLGLGIEYRNFLGLYNDISFSLIGGFRVSTGASQTPTPVEDAAPLPQLPQTAALELSDVEFGTVFPVFFKYYDEHPLGRATITNASDTPVERLRTNLVVRQFMDNATPCEGPDRLEPGESAQVALYGLFTDQVLSISEDTKVSVSIGATYLLAGREVEQDFTETLRLRNRNALVWDDDRRAAGFITPRDPTLMRFSRNVSGLVDRDAIEAIERRLCLAVVVYEALSVYGLTYMPDPTTPYAEYSVNPEAVDFVQFPKQTLEFRAGDCDDLSVLYCALLESLGIDTALITVPGHIFAAFALDMSPAASRDALFHQDHVIKHAGAVWVPVEVTALQHGFLNAWQTGADRWRQYSPAGQADIYPVHEAWTVYEPVGFAETTGGVEMPSIERVEEFYTDELSRIIDWETTDRFGELKGLLLDDPGASRLRNRLGILYARYGFLDDAQQQFELALADAEYAPSIMNLGNVRAILGDVPGSIEYYRRALELDPRDAKTLLSLARAHSSLGDSQTAAELYDRLTEVDPELASRHTDLGTSEEELVRAEASGRASEVMVWGE